MGFTLAAQKKKGRWRLVAYQWQPYPERWHSDSTAVNGKQRQPAAFLGEIAALGASFARIGLDLESAPEHAAEMRAEVIGTDDN